MKKRLDIKSFSEKIGVSTATVSRAFSGRGRISPTTRTRVLKEAKRLGFVPNVHASRLNSRKTGVIGLYYTFSDEVIFDYYNMELAQELAIAAEKRDYSIHLELGRAGGTSDKTRMRELSIGNGMDGVVVVSDSKTNGQHMVKSVKGCPVVVITSESWTPIHNEVTVELDVTSGIREAISTLAQMGHQKIGFLDSGSHGIKKRAFRFALEEHNLRYDEKLVAIADKSFSDGQLAFERIYRYKPTAILCATDIIALGAMNRANKIKCRVPEDISIVGIDDLGFTAFTTPGLATVGIPRDQVAATTIDQLIARFESDGQKTGVSRYIISSYFLNRASVASVPKS